MTTVRITVSLEFANLLEEIKMHMGMNQVAITDHMINDFIFRKIPDFYTPEYKENIQKSFNIKATQALNTKFNQESYFVLNAWNKCFFRNYLAYARNQEIPFMFVKKQVHFCKILVDNSTFPEYKSQLIKEFSELEHDCNNPERFNSMIKKQIAYRKSKGIPLDFGKEHD